MSLSRGRIVLGFPMVIRPAGRLLILDLRAHDEGWVRDTLGDRWQGFEERTLSDWLTSAGLQDVRVTVGARGAGDPFVVIVASAVKPDTFLRSRRPARHTDSQDSPR